MANKTEEEVVLEVGQVWLSKYPHSSIGNKYIEATIEEMWRGGGLTYIYYRTVHSTTQRCMTRAKFKQRYTRRIR